MENTELKEYLKLASAKRGSHLLGFYTFPTIVQNKNLTAQEAGKTWFTELKDDAEAVACFGRDVSGPILQVAKVVLFVSFVLFFFRVTPGTRGFDSSYNKKHFSLGDVTTRLSSQPFISSR